eukprot:g30324.t1
MLAQTFGCLRKNVFEGNNIRFDIKIMAYRAVVVPALFSGSELWTDYSRNLKVLEQYHQRCLRRPNGKRTIQEGIGHFENCHQEKADTRQKQCMERIATLMPNLTLPTTTFYTKCTRACRSRIS